MKIFGLEASREGAERLAAQLDQALAAHEEREFEDGEFKVRPLESVRGQSVAIYQSCAGSAAMSANDKLIRALVLAGAVRDAGAADVMLVAPYLAYSRKDRRTKPRDPVSIRYIAQMIEAIGVSEVVTVDVHNPAAFENAFRCRTRNVSMVASFVEHFRPLAARGGRVVVVSPDSGGVKRARQFADMLTDAVGRGIELAFVEKHRSEGRVSGQLFAGDVRDAAAIVVDDMICGGTTLRRAAALCLERGALSVHAAATHGLFTQAAVEALSEDVVASIVVTDTVADVRHRGSAFADRLAILASAEQIARVLR